MAKRGKLIAINLAPIEELENPLWFWRELSVFLIVSLGGIGSTQLYLAHVRGEIDQVQTQVNEHNENRQRLAGEMAEVKNLEKKLKDLERKATVLRKISGSKIERYKTVVLLEHLQNLKPAGIWFRTLVDNSAKKALYISGGAFDNLLVAEFMTSLLSTRNHYVDRSDIRSQIFFPEVDLHKVLNDKGQGSAKRIESSSAFRNLDDSRQGPCEEVSGSSLYKELTKFYSFGLCIHYDTHAVGKGDSNESA